MFTNYRRGFVEHETASGTANAIAPPAPKMQHEFFFLLLYCSFFHSVASLPKPPKSVPNVL